MRCFSLGLLLVLAIIAQGSDRLTSRSASQGPKDTVLLAGSEVKTGPGEKRRLRLENGGLLYLNANSTVKATKAGDLQLLQGEIFAEFDRALRIQSPGRKIQSDKGSLNIRVDKDGSDVAVTRGQATVDSETLGSGWALSAAKEKHPVQRVSHRLDWTKELHADSLVPARAFAGGALQAKDADGAAAKISLRKFHVDVHLEDGFARTTIDQTYFNHESSQLEGTFYFPLPPDASLSYFAMYVDGNLMEAGMVERDRARNIYETIRHANRDPALLEWVDGSTFKMRIFPLEARTEKRLILSYSQRVPALYGDLQYRFPAGHSLQKVAQWSFNAVVKNGEKANWRCTSHALNANIKAGDLHLSAEEKNARIDRDVVVALSEPAQATRDEPVFSSVPNDGADYLLMRWQPKLEATGPRPERCWLMLCETSGDRDPLLARTQIDILRDLLHQAEPNDTFLVAAANTRVRFHTDKPMSVNPENIETAMAFLEKAHLIGALDFAGALEAMKPQVAQDRETMLVHVGSGVAAMGEPRIDGLVKLLPAKTQYVGVGVGRRWNRGFMKAAAEATGGYFTHINPDEPIAWRTFDLAATLNTPRLLNVTVESDEAPFLLFSQTLAQGEELAAVTRAGPPLPGLEKEPTATQLPKHSRVRGTLAGQPFEKSFEVKVGFNPAAGYIPRSWAKLEIDRMLAADSEKYRPAIVALSKAMVVMSPFTSMLVLEHDDLYVQYKVDRDRKDHWAKYPCPAKIDVVYEPEAGQPDPRKAGKKPTEKEVRQSITFRHSPAEKKERLPVTSESLDSLGLLVIRANDPTVLNKALLSIYGDGKNGTDIREDLRKNLGEKYTNLFRNVGYGSSPERDFNDMLTPGISKKGSPFVEAGFNGVFAGFPGQGKAPRRMVEEENYIEQFTIMSPLLPPVPAPTNALRALAEPSRTEGNNRIFFDLLTYAPGMNSTQADTNAVVEAEAQLLKSHRFGSIDPTARKLIERSRNVGWQTYTTAEGLQIRFDGTGKYVSQQTFPVGLKESVVCDGQTLIHLYPQLYLAAKRDVSRFHRADFAAQVPWCVPSAEDYAHGADVVLHDPNTVTIVPHFEKQVHEWIAEQPKDAKTPTWTRLRLVFNDLGRLAEKLVVRMPQGKVELRQVLGSDGTQYFLDATGKEIGVVKGKLISGSEPPLHADTKDLIVVSLPFRSPNHVQLQLKLDKRRVDDLRFAEALPLLTANVAQGRAQEAVNVFRTCLLGREQNNLGYFVLLAACGANLDAEHLDVQNEHPDSPLAQYLALHTSPVLRKHASQWAVNNAGWTDPLLHHLATTHALYQRWQSPKIDKSDKLTLERKKGLEYIQKHQDIFGWTLLGLMQQRSDRVKHKEFYRELSQAYRQFADHPTFGIQARYESARCLFVAGEEAEARKQFLAYYQKVRDDKTLPAIDEDFRKALAADDQWTPFMTKTALDLVAQKQRKAVLALAKQCWQLEDQPLANSLLDIALEKAEGKEKTALTLAGIELLQKFGQIARADAVLQTLLADKELSQRSALWKLAHTLAEKRDMPARALECLEKALDAEEAERQEMVDLHENARDYGMLLKTYARLADTMATLEVPPTPAFFAKVIRTADRWRALDRDATEPCEQASAILHRLGESELAWDYLTTPIAMKPNESDGWLSIAKDMTRRGDAKLADEAYRAAFAAEPTNAQILWDRAENLRRSGKPLEARDLFRRIAEEHWQPRFQGLKSQAKAQVP